MIWRMLIVLLALSITACGSENAATVDEEAPAPAVEESVDVEDEAPAVELEPTSPPPTEAIEQIEPTADSGPDPALLEGVEYSVISEDTVPNIKRSLEIRLAERVPEDILEALAISLKDEDGATYERTFILYYLPDMEVGAGAWATSHFDPDLEIEILGATAEEFEAISAEQEEDSSRDIVGRWLYDNSFSNERILIFREGGATFIEFSYDDGSNRVTEYIETQEAGGIRFEDKEGSDFGDHYLLTAAGVLEIRDSEGLIATATRLDQ